MRTTLSISDDVLRELRQLARARNLSLTQIANDTLRAGLSREVRARDGASEAPRFRQQVFDLGKPLVNLDHALRVAAALEDEEAARKLDEAP